MPTRDILAVLFALVTIIGVAGGIANRLQLKKGIGAQFIRYTAIVVPVPAAVALAFQDMLTEAAVSAISGALAYAFAGLAKDEKQ